MRKIGLFISANPRNGGLLQYTRSILASFQSLPVDAFHKAILCTDKWWENELAGVSCAEFVTNGLLGRFFKLNLWLLIPGMQERLRSFCIRYCSLSKRIDAFGCDLWIFPAQDTWIYLNNSPSLAVVHDLMHRYEKSFREVGSPWEALARDRHYAQICRHAKAILVESSTGRKQLIESYGPEIERIFVLPYAPSLAIRKGRRVNRDLHDRLPPKFIFYPAQFWEHKNHKNIVLAIARLKSHFPDVHAVFAGAPKNGYEAVVKMISSMNLSNHFTFLGYVPDEDMPELYRRARALIYPTFFGPTNLPPLEAFASGCPVAVSDIYGMREQVGDAALLFDPRSVDEIAWVIRSVWTDDGLCKTLAERGMEKAGKWNQNHFSAAFANILKTVLS
jgi:glycosyltransferase involved in cell wall biosynthesis